MKKNIISQLIKGLISAIIGIAIWGLISYLTGFRLGIIGLLIGFLVGMSMSQPEEHWHIGHGILAVLVTLAAIGAGELLSLVLSLSKELGMSIKDTFSLMDLKASGEFILSNLGGKSYIIIALSLFEAFKLSKSSSNEENTESTHVETEEEII